MIHEVADSELDAIAEAAEKDPLGATSVLFNFSVALLSMGGSFLFALLTTNVPTDRLFASLVAVTFAAFVVGLVLLFLWIIFYLKSRRTRRSIAELIQKIRDRLPPPPGIQEVSPTSVPGSEADAG